MDISDYASASASLFFLNWSLHFWIVFNKLWSLLIPLIIAPWYITTMAVLYEEMRYRAGV